MKDFCDLFHLLVPSLPLSPSNRSAVGTRRESFNAPWFLNMYQKLFGWAETWYLHLKPLAPHVLVSSHAAAMISLKNSLNPGMCWHREGSTRWRDVFVDPVWMTALPRHCDTVGLWMQPPKEGRFWLGHIYTPVSFPERMSMASVLQA